MKYFWFHLIFGVIFLSLSFSFFEKLEFNSVVYGFSFFSLNYFFLYLVFSRIFKLAVKQGKEGVELKPKRLGPFIFFIAFKFIFLGAGVYFGLVYFALDGIYLVGGALGGLLLAAAAGVVFSGAISLARLFGVAE